MQRCDAGVPGDCSDQLLNRISTARPLLRKIGPFMLTEAAKAGRPCDGLAGVPTRRLQAHLEVRLAERTRHPLGELRILSLAATG